MMSDIPPRLTAALTDCRGSQPPSIVSSPAILKALRRTRWHRVRPSGNFET
jgi:hypothetical protein